MWCRYSEKRIRRRKEGGRDIWTDKLFLLSTDIYTEEHRMRWCVMPPFPDVLAFSFHSRQAVVLFPFQKSVCHHAMQRSKHTVFYFEPWGSFPHYIR